MNKKKIALILAAVLMLTMVIGGTVAWLVDTTDEVKNTFTTSDVDITLTETNVDGDSETENSYQMIPGFTIEKDPKVTVLADSEKCYVFVKVTKSANFDSFMTYDIADCWTELNEGSGIYYQVVEDTTADQPFFVIENNTVIVKTSVTKQMMDEIEAGKASEPTLTFTAYATQYFKTNGAEFSATEAWANVSDPTDANP